MVSLEVNYNKIENSGLGMKVVSLKESGLSYNQISQRLSEEDGLSVSPRAIIRFLQDKGEKYKGLVMDVNNKVVQREFFIIADSFKKMHERGEVIADKLYNILELLEAKILEGGDHKDVANLARLAETLNRNHRQVLSEIEIQAKLMGLLDDKKKEIKYSQTNISVQFNDFLSNARKNKNLVCASCGSTDVKFREVL